MVLGAGLGITIITSVGCECISVGVDFKTVVWAVIFLYTAGRCGFLCLYFRPCIGLVEAKLCHIPSATSGQQMSLHPEKIEHNCVIKSRNYGIVRSTERKSIDDEKLCGFRYIVCTFRYCRENTRRWEGNTTVICV